MTATTTKRAGRIAVAQPAPQQSDGSSGSGWLLRRSAWFVRHYPITVLVFAPYALLVIPIAAWNRNPDLGFILSLVAVAVGTVATVETVAWLLARSTVNGDRVGPMPVYPRAFTIARVVAVTGAAADITAAYAGRGTIATQLAGGVAESPIAHLAATLAGWKYVAVALLCYSIRSQTATVASFYRWAGMLIGAQLVVLSVTAISAPAMAFVAFVAAIGAFTGIVRARYVLATVVVLLLAWPTLFALRNEVRVANGVRVQSEHTAFDRLRVDLQMSRLRAYEVPVDVGQPGLAELLRYGFVPRTLDPDRPPLSTGVKINVYLGGSSDSAYGFAALGNVYFLEGLLGVVLFYLCWPVVAVLLLRAGRPPGPVRLTVFCLIVAGPLAWSATYPDTMIGIVQHVIAALPVFFLLALDRRPALALDRRPASGQPA